MGYVIGHNMPGYLPMDDDEPYIYESAEDARNALVDDLHHWRDSVEMGGDQTALADAIDDAANEVYNADVSQGYSVIVCDPDREHDLGQCYWVEIAEDLLPYDNPDSPEFWQR